MKVEQQTPIKPQEEIERGEREISLEEIFKIVLRRKYGIILVMALSLFAAIFYHYTETPEYHAVAVMMINDNKEPTDLLATVLGSGAAVDNKAVKKDVELIKSMPIAMLAVGELYKSARRDSLEFFEKRIYRSPVSRFFSQLNVFTPLNADQNPPNWALSDEELRRYAVELNKRISVEAARETNVLKVSVASPFADEAAYLSNTLCRVYREADINRNSEKYAQANKFIAEMLGDQQKKVGDADYALSKYMEANEIYELTGNTQQLLNKLVEADAKFKSIQAEYNIANNGLAFLEKKLSESDRAISSQIAKNVSNQLGSIMDEIKGLESEYMQLVQEKGVDNADVKAKRQQLEVVKTRYEQLSRSKIAGEIGYAGKAQKFSFDMVSEKLQIQRKLNELSFSSREFSRLKEYYEGLLGQLPEKQQDYIKLQRDREVVGKTYLYLKEKLDETRIMLGSEVGGVSVIGSAFVPFKPEKPNLKKNMLMGLVLGGLLAVLFTYTAELVDDSVKDDSFFRDIGLATLSIIPLVPGEKNAVPSREVSGFNRILYNTSKAFREKVLLSGNGAGKRKGAQPKVETPMPMITDSLSSSFAESFRTLRTALDYSRVESPLKSLLISGTAMSEGKSTVCSNLAMAYALVGKKTIIVDCDFRRASQHKKFSVKREKGLTDYLFGEDRSIDESYFQATHVDNLFLLSSGKKVPNPNELLGSAKMQDLIRELETKFDKVIIDSPPLFLSDAAQLAHSIDGILLVSRLQFTSRKPIQDFVSDHFMRPLLLGVALIGSRQGTGYGYGKYGYGKYGYGKYGYGKYQYGQYEEQA
jgi:capsular exopolysaccharide synthesis family protein